MSESDHASAFISATLTEPEIKKIEQQAFRDGVKAGASTLPGIAAWGLVAGVAMIKSHFTITQELGMALLVFAGSAQLAALPLIASGAPVWVIFLSGLVVNLRFVIYSVIIAPHLPQLKLWQKTFWGYLIGDVSMVFFMRRYPNTQPEIGKFSYAKGLFTANWIAWQIGSVAGVFLGSVIPEDWGVGFAGTLAILCVLLPMVISHSILIGVAVSGAIAVTTYHWPYRIGMLLAVVAGMASSIAWQTRQERSRSVAIQKENL